MKGDFYRGGALWLGKIEVLPPAEVEELLTLRDYRNEVAHELARFLIDIDKSLDFNRYARLVELLQKIDRWRVRLNIDCNEDYDGQDIKDEDIHSGSMMLVDMMNRMILRLGGVEVPP